MSASIEANILVCADNVADPAHGAARDLIERLATGPDLLYLFWPSVLGYLRIVTHPGNLRDPVTPAEAVRKTSKPCSPCRTLSLQAIVRDSDEHIWRPVAPPLAETPYRTRGLWR